MHGMQGGNLTGHVEAIDRHRWRLIVNLPAATAGTRRRYPRTVRTVDASSKRAAERALSDWIAELEAHDCTDPSRLIVSELCRRWIDAIDVRPKTRQFYSDNVRLHIAPTLGAMLARDLRPSHLTALYATLRDRGLSETSRHHVHATVRAAFSWAGREELVDRNPAEYVQDPPRQSRRDVVTWTQDDIARGLHTADGLQVLVPLALGAWAGLRAGEMCGLRWPDCDLDAGVLHIVRSLEQTRDGLHVVAPKSSAGVRDVPIPRQLVEILRDEKVAMDEMSLAHHGAWNREQHVCCRQSGEPMRPNDLSSSWRRFCARHALPVVRLHDLRHSYATELFEQGGTDKERMLKVVQERLGHAQSSTTADIYLHVTEHASRAATDEQERRIDVALAKVAQNSHVISTRVISLDERRRQKRRK
jgi:integrase